MPLLDKGTKDTVRVPITVGGEAHWIDIKARPSVADRRDIQRRILNATHGRGLIDAMATGQAGDVVEMTEFVTLELAIVGWSDDAPVTAENLRALPDEALDAVRAAINEHWPGARTDEQAKNSSGGGAPTAEGSDPLPASSAG